MSDLFAGLTLGREFLIQPPLFHIIETRDEVTLKLCLNCQCHWLRLYFVSPQSFAIATLKSVVLGTGGIVEGLQVWQDSNAAVELFVRSWRLGVLSSLGLDLTEVYQMEGVYFQLLLSDPERSAQCLSLQWKNIAAYLKKYTAKHIEILWTVTFLESPIADRVMSDLEAFQAVQMHTE